MFAMLGTALVFSTREKILLPLGRGTDFPLGGWPVLIFGWADLSLGIVILAGGGPFAPDSSSDCHETARLSLQTQNNQNHNDCHSLRRNSNRLLRNDSNSPLRHNKSRLLCTNKSLYLHNSSLESLLAYHRRVTYYGPVNNRHDILYDGRKKGRRGPQTEKWNRTNYCCNAMHGKENQPWSFFGYPGCWSC